MFVSQSGRPAILPNVEAAKQPITRLSVAPNRRWLCCLTQGSLVLFANDRLKLRPIARWSRVPPTAGEYGNLINVEWGVESSTLYALTSDRAHICVFEIQTAARELVRLASTDSARVSEESGRRSLGPGVNPRSITRLLALFGSADGDSPVSVSESPTNSEPSLSIFVPTTPSSECVKQSSYRMLAKEMTLPRRIHLAAVLALPLSLHRVLIPPPNLCPDISGCGICALALQPALVLLNLANVSKGVNSILYLDELTLRGVGPNKTSAFVSLRNAWSKGVAEPVESQLVFPPKERDSKSSLTALLVTGSGSKHKASHKASRDPAAEKSDHRGIVLCELSELCNLLFVAFNGGWSLLLRFSTLQPVHGSGKWGTGPNSVEPIGRTVPTGGGNIMAFKFIPRRREAVALRTDGRLLVMGFETALNIGYTKTVIETGITGLISIAETILSPMESGGAFAIGTLGKELKVVDREGNSLYVLPKGDQEVPTADAAWISSDCFLVAACGHTILGLEFVRSAVVSPSLRIPFSSASSYGALLERKGLRLVVERPQDVSEVSWRSIPFSTNHANITCFVLNSNVTYGLLNADDTLRIVCLRMRDAYWGVLASANVIDGGGTVHTQFRFEPSGPIGWYLEDVLFFTARVTPPGTTMSSFTIVFGQLKHGKSYQIGMKLLGCTKPSALLPSHVTVLTEDVLWRPSANDSDPCALYNLMRSLSIPHPSDLLERGLPVFGILHTDSSFTCLTAHNATSSCRTGHRCSSGFTRQYLGLGDQVPLWCFSTSYVCQTGLRSPLEIRFVMDAFSLLIRDCRSYLRMGYVCDPLGNERRLVAGGQVKPIRSSSTTLTVSAPLLQRPVVSMSSLVPWTPAFVAKADFVALGHRSIADFEYCVQTRGSGLLRRERTADLATENPEDSALARLALSNSSSLRQVDVSATTLDCEEVMSSPRTCSAESGDSQEELLAQAPGWNFVSGAIGRQPSLQLSASSSSVTHAATLTSISDRTDLLTGLELATDREATRQRRHASEYFKSNGYPTTLKRSQRRASRVLGEDNVGDDAAQVIRLGKIARSAYTRALQEDLTRSEPVEVATTMMASQNPVYEKDFASGGVDMVAHCHDGTYLLNLSCCIFPFAPQSPILVKGRSFAPRHRSPTISDEDCDSGPTLWTQRLSCRTVQVCYLDGQTATIPIAASKVMDSLLYARARVWSGSRTDSSPRGLAARQLPGTDLEFVSFPMLAKILAHLAASPSQCLTFSGNSTQINHRSFNALCLPAVISYVHARRSLEEGLIQLLEAALPTLQPKLGSVARDEAATPEAIRNALELSASHPAIVALSVYLTELKDLQLDLTSVLVRASRVHEPLVSPFVVMPLAGYTLDRLFVYLLGQRQLRTAMNLLIPLQQACGPEVARIRHGCVLLEHALKTGSLPVVMDLLRFMGDNTILSGGLWKPSKSTVPVMAAIEEVITAFVGHAIIDHQWRLLLSVVATLHLDLPQWGKKAVTMLKPVFGVEQFHELGHPRLAMELQRNCVHKAVRSLRQAFLLKFRCVPLSTTVYRASDGTLEPPPPPERKPRETLPADWGLPILFATAVVNRLPLLATALAVACADPLYLQLTSRNHK